MSQKKRNDTKPYSPIKSINELERLLEDERSKFKHEYAPEKQLRYKPLVIDGSEVANSRKSGFPDFNDIVLVCEEALKQNFSPITVIIDDSLQFLLEHEATILLVETIKEGGFQVKDKYIKLIEVKDQDKATEKILFLAYRTNSRILINNLIKEHYEDKFTFLTKSKNWQVTYTIKDDVKLSWL
ncbi:MAG: hypothetical protein ACXAC7_02980 [Candidatus Hodarchaeales archaeon]|jgi:hypothetical protein